MEHNIENYRNLVEDLLEEKEELLKKLETNGAHPLRIKALKSEIRRCKLVLEGRRYDRKRKKEKLETATEVTEEMICQSI